MKSVLSRFFILSFLLFSFQSYSQLSKWLVHETNGQLHLVDFSTTPPTVSIPSPGYGVSGDEDVNLMTDSAGNILFSYFCNGANTIEVRDRNWSIMPGGTGLFGHSSSLKSCIVKIPCTTNMYYIVHLSTAGGGGNLYYSILDMTANGGMGDVVQKNIFLGTNFDEGLSISHQMRNGCRWLFASRTLGNSQPVCRLLISATGIGTPVVVTTNNYSVPAVSPHDLKISPDNSKVAMSTLQTDILTPDIFVWDFNLNTGELLNRVDYSVSDQPVIGIEFSPDNSKIYWRTNMVNDNSQLGRIDLVSGVISLINNNFGRYGTAIETAGNGKLYMSHNYNIMYMSEIADPNNSNIALIGFTYNAVLVSGSGCRVGLPNAINGEVPGTSVVPGTIDFSYAATTNCNEFIFMDSTCLGSWWEWDFGDSSYSNLEFPTHTYLTGGSYDVTLRVLVCSDTLSLTKNIQVNQSFGIQSTPAACLSANGTVTVTSNGGSGNFSYQWDPPNDTTLSTISGLVVGGYSVIVTDLVTGCSQALSTIVANSSGISASITSFSNATCESDEDGSATVVALGGQPPYFYLWPNGDTTSITTHLAPGTYLASVEDYDGCRSFASVTIGFDFASPSLDLGPDSLPCIGTSFMMDAGSGFTSYLWSDNSTNQTLTVSNSGIYSVLVTNLNGCQSFDDINVSFVTCIQNGIILTDLNHSYVHIYPNPAKSEVNLLFNGLIKGEIEIKLMDLIGNQIFMFKEQVSMNYHKAIDIQKLPSGLYLIKIVYNDEVIIKRLVKL